MSMYFTKPTIDEQVSKDLIVANNMFDMLLHKNINSKQPVLISITIDYKQKCENKKDDIQSK